MAKVSKKENTPTFYCDAMLGGLHSNLFKSAPEAVLNHPTLVTMRRQLLTPGCEPPEVCRTCNLLGETGW